MQNQSFSSSSSSSFSSSDLKNTTKFIIGALCRLFCFRDLPKYSFDGHQKETPPKTAAVAPVPIQTQGVIATLMGLQPMPPESISRRRKSETNDEFTGACFELENEDFLILTFDRKVGKGSKFTETSFGGLNKERTKKKQRDKQGFPKVTLKNDGECIKSNYCSRILHPTKSNENEDLKLVKARTTDFSTVETSDAEIILENLSPVSVLDCGEFLTHTMGVDFSLEKRKSSTNLAIPGTESSTESKTIIEKGDENKRKRFLQVWSEIWLVAAVDTTTDLNWVNGVFENDAISADFGLQILDETLKELVDELVIQLTISA